MRTFTLAFGSVKGMLACYQNASNVAFVGQPQKGPNHTKMCEHALRSKTQHCINMWPLPQRQIPQHPLPMCGCYNRTAACRAAVHTSAAFLQSHTRSSKAAKDVRWCAPPCIDWEAPHLLHCRARLHLLCKENTTSHQAPQEAILPATPTMLQVRSNVVFQGLPHQPAWLHAMHPPPKALAARASRQSGQAAAHFQDPTGRSQNKQ
jgi:hypothetical protein